MYLRYTTLSFSLSQHGKTVGEEPPEKAKNVFQRMSQCYDKDVASTLWIYLPSLSEFTLRSQHVTVYIVLKSIFIAFLSVQQMEHLQTLECGSLCRRQLSLNRPEG